MIKVLIIDDDLDSHELLNDVLHINFPDVSVERALDSQSFLKKISKPDAEYDLVLFRSGVLESESDILTQAQNHFPALLDKTVLMTNDKKESFENPVLKKLPKVSKPFSLDHFGEVIRNVLTV